jgi:hypothetical protein
VYWSAVIPLCLALSSHSDVPDRAGREEAKRASLEGEWKVVAAQYCGRNEDGFLDFRVTARGGKASIRSWRGSAEWDYKLGRPAGAVDVSFSHGDERLTVLGCYTLGKDTLTVSCLVGLGPCGVVPAEERPRPFEAKATPGLLVLTLRRERP